MTPNIINVILFAFFFADIFGSGGYLPCKQRAASSTVETTGSFNLSYLTIDNTIMGTEIIEE